VTLSILSDAAVLRGGPVVRRKGLSKHDRARMRIMKMLQFIYEIAGAPREEAPFERLEPCEGKLSRTVPRGCGWANLLRLPGAASRR
jgi:hypothetical protein